MDMGERWRNTHDFDALPTAAEHVPEQEHLYYITGATQTNPTRAHNAFAAQDVRVSINDSIIGTIQSLKLTTHTASAHTRTTPSGIETEGSISCILFDRHSFSDILPENTTSALELPPFVMRIDGTDEYGHTSGMTLRDCVFIEEKTKFSVADNPPSTQEFIFKARTIEPWAPVVRADEVY